MKRTCWMLYHGDKWMSESANWEWLSGEAMKAHGTALRRKHVGDVFIVPRWL